LTGVSEANTSQPLWPIRPKDLALIRRETIAPAHFLLQGGFIPMVKHLSVAEHGLRYNGELIRRGADGMVNLTDMWRAAGSLPNKEPPNWMRLT